MKRFKDAVHERMKYRTDARAVADSLMLVIAEKVDAVPRAHQGPILTMIQTEINQLLRDVGREAKEK